ncbi:MAG: permease component of ribose/xylose/arabinose/galactoside ABC-type transporter [Phycisphaerales bacterium]|nr:permease component of ribose/xylose/arabinose/galactoside ABC-type transporter [Phycisphaerales bacterium]
MTRALYRYRREASVALAYGLLLAALAMLAPTFFRSEFRGTWVRAAPVLVAAAGMTLVIVARQIDISIGSQFSACGIVAALAAKVGVPMPAVAVLTIVLGMLMGSVNGALVAFARLPSIVVTLATMVIWREAVRWTREGEAVNNLPAAFQWFGLNQSVGEWAVLGSALAVGAIVGWIASNLAGGRAVYAVGSDADAARLAGVRPKHVTFAVFVIAGGLVGLAAMLNAVRFPQVDPNAGFGLELTVIAAVVVGGTAISGGRGTLGGTLVGVALLTTIGSALTFLKLPAQWERAVQGAIILTAVASDRLFRAGKE